MLLRKRQRQRKLNKAVILSEVEGSAKDILFVSLRVTFKIYKESVTPTVLGVAFFYPKNET